MKSNLEISIKNIEEYLDNFNIDDFEIPMEEFEDFAGDAGNQWPTTILAT